MGFLSEAGYTVISEETALELMLEHQHAAGYLPRLEREMPEYRKDPIKSVAGRVGKAPERRGTPKGDVVGFTLAVPTGYSDDDKPIWFDVSVWNEELQDSVEAELDRGMAVAVEGFYTVREYNGQKYPQLNATKVGMIEFLARSKGRRSTAPARREPDPIDDELPF